MSELDRLFRNKTVTCTYCQEEALASECTAVGVDENEETLYWCGCPPQETEASDESND